MAQTLFALNPDLPTGQLAASFAAERRVQVRDVLTPESARLLQRVLRDETVYGFAYQGDQGGPERLGADAIRMLAPNRRAAIGAEIHRAAASGAYAVRFNSYAILDAYLANTDHDGPHDILLEHLNAPPFLNLVRAITGIPGLCKADAQATVFGPGDFLSIHADSHKAEGWRVAYVLNLADADWRPDWGGYLNFFDDDGDVVAGWRPRFNALNLFAVPQPHNVSYVPSFAPLGRYAITGWLRDR